MTHENDVSRIGVADLTRLMASEPVAILDVRRRDAWATERARIPGAIWLPLEEVPERMRDLPRERRLVVYCS